MSIQDEAARVLHEHHENCNDAARALADAGLLAPELPPYSDGNADYAAWNLEHITISADPNARSVYVDGGPLTPQQAREESHALLAAAKYAEKETPNDR